MKKGYGVGVVVSLSMHGLLIALMITTFEMPQKPRTVVPPAYVNATLLVVDGVPQMEARTEPAPEPAPPPPPPPPQQEQEERQAEQRRREEEARRAEEQRQQAQRAEQQQREAEAQRKAEQEARIKAKQEADKKAEEEARRKADEEAERKAEEEARRQEEARRKEEEARRKKAEEEQRRAEAAAEAERQRREEEQFMQAAAAREAVNTYEGLVQQRIADRWSRPPSARRNMEVELSISMTPNGQIQDVVIVRSSGDATFDQSAIHAVQRVDRIPEFQQLDPAVFNANFRRFNLLFRPDDLRL